MIARDERDVLDHGVLRFLTAGSVDDGKSTLIGRLLYDTRAILADQLAAIERTSQRRGSALDLSLLTDGLTAEREQGITIDVAYCYFATGLRKFIIADTPGHEQYTRNMVTAASTAQLAVLLVDARHGVVTQTRRHARIAHLLGIPHVVVAVNKMDLAGWSRAKFDEVRKAFDAFARRIGLANVRYVPMSALLGDMVVERSEHLGWYDGPTLLSILESVEVEETLDRAPFRFPVQQVGRPEADVPRRYLGRVEAGSIRVGERVRVLPSGRTTRIRAIGTHDALLERAPLHANVALVLDDELDIARGDVIVREGDEPRVTTTLEADVCWLGDAPLDARRPYLLHHMTREVRAKVASVLSHWDVDSGTVERTQRDVHPNDIARIRFTLAQPLCVDPYARSRPGGSFILVDESSNATVAAGMVAV